MRRQGAGRLVRPLFRSRLGLAACSSPHYAWLDVATSPGATHDSKLLVGRSCRVHGLPHDPGLIPQDYEFSFSTCLVGQTQLAFRLRYTLRPSVKSS